MTPPVDDLIIVLPGILGSVLQKNGKDLWAPSLSAVSRLFSRDALSRELMVAQENQELDDLGDGVTATRLLDDIHLIPGFWKIDGYSTLTNFIANTVGAKLGQIDAPDPSANLFPFPYDWRRDNRVSARKLKRFVDTQLPRWRETSGAKNARVILIGHSMGGLISRYYLEVLGGWEQCAALFTFGTPHRGSVCALSFLNSGYKLLQADVTDALRSFDSVYQLLPTYRVIEGADGYKRVTEAGPIPGIDPQRAAAAMEFHNAISTAVEARKDSAQSNAYVPFLIVGTRQPTLQSAALSNGQIVARTTLPPALSQMQVPEYGDGTVPYISAIPADLVDAFRETYAPEAHGSLQANAILLGQLQEQFTRLQARDWGAILGDTSQGQALSAPAIAVALDDMYAKDEPVVIHASLLDLRAQPGAVEALVTPLDKPEAAAVHQLREVGGEWVLTLEGLPPSDYRVVVRTVAGGDAAPPPVTNFFEVV